VIVRDSRMECCVEHSFARYAFRSREVTLIAGRRTTGKETQNEEDCFATSRCGIPGG
jgi:hypothetical protein